MIDNKAEAERLAERAFIDLNEACFYQDLIDEINAALDAAEQRGREKGLDEAAIKCEEQFATTTNGMHLVNKGYANAIRALKGEKK